MSEKLILSRCFSRFVVVVVLVVVAAVVVMCCLACMFGCIVYFSCISKLTPIVSLCVYVFMYIRFVVSSMVYLIFILRQNQQLPRAQSRYILCL